MSGIIACIGSKPCRQAILEGLCHLECREYDSAGFACIDSNHGHINYHKEAGGIVPIKRLIEAIHFDGSVGVAHTRWATHGIVDEHNAHPHFNCNKSIAVVHNGILEAHEEIRQKLIDQGHTFTSSTDTEVAAHLLEALVDQCKDLKKAIMELVKRLKGAYALVFLLEQLPDKLIVIRHRSPMSLGIGNGEVYAASDLVAFTDKTRNVIFMPDDTVAFLSKDGVELYGFDGRSIPYYVQEIDESFLTSDKEGFEHHFLKEILEQKRAISRTISFYKVIGNYNEAIIDDDIALQKNHLHVDYSDAIWRHVGLTTDMVKDLEHIHLIGAGTSYHASCIARFFFEHVCNIPTYAHLSSEFRYAPFFIKPNGAYVVISQSGETADTLESLRLVNSFEQHTIALTNVASSNMVREASGFLPMQAGPEISGASTKAFSAQLASLYWLAHRIALDCGKVTPEQMLVAEESLFIAAEILEAAIDGYKFKIVQELAPHYATYDHFIFLGRHISYPLAQEAAFKISEISHVFAQCYPAGELRNGPISIINDKAPVVLFSVLDDLIYQKMIENARDIKSRNGHLIVFAFEGQRELIELADCVFVLPRVTPMLAPLAMTGLMQFFIYHISRCLGQPIDKPRVQRKQGSMDQV